MNVFLFKYLFIYVKTENRKHCRIFFAFLPSETEWNKYDKCERKRWVLELNLSDSANGSIKKPFQIKLWDLFGVVNWGKWAEKQNELDKEREGGLPVRAEVVP